VNPRARLGALFNEDGYMGYFIIIAICGACWLAFDGV
jgi:hypothetical protein